MCPASTLCSTLSALLPIACLHRIKPPADVEGNEYFDMLQCAGTLALGHNHDVSIQAAKDVRTGRSPPPPGTTAWRRSAQFLESGQPMQVLDLNSPLKVEFMQQLKSVLPKNLTRYAASQLPPPAPPPCTTVAMQDTFLLARRH